MPRLGKKGKHPNNTSKPAPAKHSRKENLTKDDISTIMEAVLDTMEACANPEPRSEHQTTHSSGCQVTCKNVDNHATHSQDNTRSHYLRERNTVNNVTDTKTGHLPETRDDTTSAADQDIDEYNYVLSTLT